MNKSYEFLTLCDNYYKKNNKVSPIQLFENIIQNMQILFTIHTPSFINKRLYYFSEMLSDHLEMKQLEMLLDREYLKSINNNQFDKYNQRHINIDDNIRKTELYKRSLINTIDILKQKYEKQSTCLNIRLSKTIESLDNMKK